MIGHGLILRVNGSWKGIWIEFCRKMRKNRKNKAFDGRKGTREKAKEAPQRDCKQRI
jgi:hypothetical protein